MIRMPFFAASAISTAMSICALRGRQGRHPYRGDRAQDAAGAPEWSSSRTAPSATGRRTGSPDTGACPALSALTRKRIRRGSFHSLGDLQATINRYLTEHNADPKLFIRTASAAAILTKLSECFIRVSALPPDVPSARQHLAHRVDKVLNAIVIVGKVGDEISALG